MTGSFRYSATDPDGRLRGSIQHAARDDEGVSAPAVPMRTSRTSVLLGSVLGVGAGLVIVALLSSAVRDSDVTLAETPAVSPREPAFTINPGYMAALAIPGDRAATSVPDHVSLTPAPYQESNADLGPVGPQASGQSSTDSGAFDERENVSGLESPTQDDRPMNALGRETNVGVPDLDVGDLDVRGPDRSQEDDLQERLDMAPTEAAPNDSLPSVGTKPNLPGTDNPY